MKRFIQSLINCPLDDKLVRDLKNFDQHQQFSREESELFCHSVTAPTKRGTVLNQISRQVERLKGTYRTVWCADVSEGGGGVVEVWRIGGFPGRVIEVNDSRVGWKGEGRAKTSGKKRKKMRRKMSFYMTTVLQDLKNWRSCLKYARKQTKCTKVILLIALRF